MSSIEIKNNQSESSSKNMIINENNLEISEELKSDYKEKENSIKNENLSTKKY
jgi:hypothetical protein